MGSYYQRKGAGRRTKLESKLMDDIDDIIQNEIPIVMFDKINKLVNCSKVIIDDQQAAYNAVDHLIKKGYRRIAHFRGSLNPQNSIDRFLGYRKALTDNGINFDPSIVYLCDNNDDFNDGYINAKKLLQEENNVDAIFAITDLVAVGILKYFNENNIKVPDEIAVFGFSDWFMSSVVTPSLSSVKQPSLNMGIKATEILIEEIEKKKNDTPVSFQNIVLPTELIFRDST
ncbi:MAG: substrate-binding domain-containing protein [Mariprofundaceae bacterium]|nr:substrate-binding domain-containing protein [Mariprofundaceae bacterium]